MVILALCFLKQFQQIKYQRILLCIATSLMFLLPVSLKTAPLIIGVHSAICALAIIWCQLYVPSAIRATTAGITGGIMGLLIIRSTTIQERWDESVIHYTWASGVLVVCVALASWFSVRLNHSTINKTVVWRAPDSILKLIKRYPYIFIASILAGFNGAMFSYTYFLAIEAFLNINLTMGIVDCIFVSFLIYYYSKREKLSF